MREDSAEAGAGAETEAALRAGLPRGPLQVSSLRGDCSAWVPRWLELGGDPNALLRGGERSLLHHACYDNEPAAIEALLRAGADPNRPDAEGRYPIQFLEDNAVVGCPEYIEDCTYRFDWTEEREAAYRAQARAGIALLLARGARDVSRVFAAVLARDVEGLRALLAAGYPSHSYRRALARGPGPEGRHLRCPSTPLQQALATGNRAGCELLLAHGATPATAWTLRWALDFGGTEMFEWCLQHGADPNSWHDEGSFRGLLGPDPIGRRELELLREHGFDPYRDGGDEGPPAAFGLCWVPNAPEWFTVFPPEPDKVYRCGATLLHAAILCERPGVVHWLLERGADPDLPGLVNALDPGEFRRSIQPLRALGATSSGKPLARFRLTPLMMAVLTGQVHLAMAFAERGADLRWRVPAEFPPGESEWSRGLPVRRPWKAFDYTGWTAPELAARHGLRVVAEWFRYAGGAPSDYRKIEYLRAQVAWMRECAAGVAPAETQRRWDDDGSELSELAAVEGALQALHVFDGWPEPPPQIRAAAIAVAAAEFDSGLIESVTPGKERSFAALIGCLYESREPGSAQDLGKFAAAVRHGLERLERWLDDVRF